MTRELRIVVPGVAEPGGSKRALPLRGKAGGLDWSDLPKRVREAAGRAQGGSRNVAPRPTPVISSESMNARHLAIKLLESMCPQHSLCVVVVDGDPPSKARPRFLRSGRPYTPTKTIEGEKRIAARLGGVGPFKSNVAVACIFFRASRQRIDVDNMMKAVLDAGTRAHLWEDDSQVTALVGVVEYDPDRPRLVICFGEHSSSLTRGDAAMVACEACGTRFFPGGKRREKARWCSKRCRMILADPIPCPSCGGQFKRKIGYQKYCSSACRGIGQTKAAQIARSARTHCRRGHPLREDSVYVLPNGHRRCLRCQAAQAKTYRRNILRALNGEVA